MQPKMLLAAHGGQVVFDEIAYQHILSTAPRSPATHWRVTQVKLRGLAGSLWRFAVGSKKGRKESEEEKISSYQLKIPKCETDLGPLGLYLTCLDGLTTSCRSYLGGY